MSFKTGSILLAALLLGALPPGARAQVDTTRTVLPDIAPREVEIRGQLEIAFPALQRQPLVGFNPPPRVPNIPAGRRPFVEDYRRAGGDMPASALRRPQPPSALSGAAYPPQRGQVEGVGGRYYSRSVRARVAAPMDAKTALLTRLDYAGSDGHTPSEAQPRSRFDAVEGGLGVQYTGARWAVGGGLEGFYETYDLYGAVPTSPGGPALVRLPPERTGQGGAGTFRLRTVAGTPVTLNLGLRLSAARFDTRLLEGDAADAAPELTERRFEADLDLARAIPSGSVWIDGAVSAGSLADGLGTSTSLDGGAGLRLHAGRLLHVTVGGRFLAAFSTTGGPVRTDETARIGYASPDIRVELVPARGLRFYAQNRPGMAPNALADVLRTHPYLVAQPVLRPTLRSVDAEAGANVFLGPVQVALQAGFQEMPQYLFFENAPETGFDAGFTALRYARAQVYHAGGSVSINLPAGLYAMLGASYRDGRLPDADDADIPYFAPIVGEGTLSYSFAGSKGLLQLTGHYQNARPVSRAESREVGAYLDLDAEAAYNVTKLLGLVVRLDNIAGNDNARWDRYPEPPLVLGAGLRLQW